MILSKCQQQLRFLLGNMETLQKKGSCTMNVQFTDSIFLFHLVHSPSHLSQSLKIFFFLNRPSLCLNLDLIC